MITYLLVVLSLWSLLTPLWFYRKGYRRGKDIGFYTGYVAGLKEWNRSTDNGDT